MENFKKKQALDYHAGSRPGKIAVVSTKPTSTQRDISLAYSPGVAEPCIEIEKIRKMFTNTPPKAIWWL